MALIDTVESLFKEYSNNFDISEDLQNMYVASAVGIVSDYLGYDCKGLNETSEIKGEYSVQKMDALKIAKICNAALRVATLLSLEAKGNLGVNSSGEFGATRSYLNIVDYEPYLRILSTCRLTGGEKE